MMLRFYLRCAVAPAALLLGLTCAAHSEKQTPQAKDVFFARDAVVNNVTGGDGVVGFARAGDVDGKTNPTSPSVRFAAGNSLSGTLLVLNSSHVLISGLKIGQNLTVSSSSTVSLSGGSVGGTLLASDTSTVNVSGGSVGQALAASDSSTVNLSGGSVGTGLIVEKHGSFNVSGGKIGKKVIVNDGGTLRLLGTSLSKTLTSAEASLDGGSDVSYSLYTLSGKLRDGTSVNGKLVLVQNKTGAKLILTNAAAPQKAKSGTAH